LYFERSGLSTNKKKLSALISGKAETNKPEFAVRDPYVFEFLGLKAKEVMIESHHEDALLDRLQDFLLELGHGFCFEARLSAKTVGNCPCGHLKYKDGKHVKGMENHHLRELNASPNGKKRDYDTGNQMKHRKELENVRLCYVPSVGLLFV